MEYEIHDNGGRPFRVKIVDGNVSIFINDSDELVESYEPERVFIGKSPEHGEKFDGNSILLKLEGNQYIFIGWDIFSFESYFEIIDYISPVGNSDVPYPYATDTQGNRYLLTEKMVVHNEEDDPYRHYYRASCITPDKSYHKPTPLINPNFQGIVEWYLDDDEYTLTYSRNPEKRYDRFTSNGETMFLKKADGQKYEIGNDEYCQLIRDYGEEMGFQKMMDVEIIKKRLW